MKLSILFLTSCSLIARSREIQVCAFSTPAPKSKPIKSRISGSSAQDKKRLGKKKRDLPETELINRRKSPALWRVDGTNDNDNDNNVHDDALRTRAPRLPKRPPEVMAPCGGFPQLKAAIANGADSIYLGLTAFSARARASNFSPRELHQAVQIAHKSGVRVYVAMNTLVFQEELHEVAEWIQVCDEAGVDALIVQDIGVTKLAKTIAPNLEIHASTQQTVTNTDGVMYAKERGGATRVVLGRELSVKEIQAVTKDLEDMNQDDVEVEAFVHGALCVSYSGQCFSSEAWGGRSANRGQCAQACRLPYGLIQNGELVDLQDMNYLLSPQDLCGLEQVEDLVRAGVSCLKIEGRLKDENYVAATTRAYRNAVDAAWEKIVQEREQEQGDDDDAVDDEAAESTIVRKRILDSHENVSKEELAQLFSRGQDESNDGLTSGFFEGSQHQRLVRGRSPRHRGIHIGRVMKGSSPRNGILVSSDDFSSTRTLKRGDGIVIDRGMPQEEELGGPIFDVQDMNDGTTLVRFGNGVEKEWKKTDDSSRRGYGSRVPLAPPGAHVWKTSDATVDKKMRRLIDAAPPRGLVKVTVRGQIGSTVSIEITDLITGKVGTGESEGVLEEPEQRGLDEKSIRKAIGTLGNTQWKMLEDGGSVDLDGLEMNSWCPISWVKKARQRAVEDLSNQSISSDADAIGDGNLLGDDLSTHHNSHAGVVAALIDDSIHSTNEHDDHKEKASHPSMAVLARDQKQVDALCEMIEAGFEVDEIIVDFLEVDGMREAVSRVRQMGDDNINSKHKRTRVVVATPRIIKPGEEGIWKSLLRLEPDGLLIRAAGLVHKMTTLGGKGADVDLGEGQVVQIPELIGDFSLNAINTVTSSEMLVYGGLSHITTGYDLSADSITEQAKAMDGGSFNKARGNCPYTPTYFSYRGKFSSA